MTDLDLNINPCCCICDCPNCGYKTDVYSIADVQMWTREGLRFPSCPYCKMDLKVADEQYKELD